MERRLVTALSQSPKFNATTAIAPVPLYLIRSASDNNRLADQQVQAIYDLRSTSAFFPYPHRLKGFL
jgi:hypothetical protein